MGLVDEHEALTKAFGRAAPAHYEWQTRGAVIAERERALVHAAFMPLGKRILDLGCGEGATLRHLEEPEGATGLDLFGDKIAFAATQLPRCKFVEGSVYELPFPDASFDHVLVRDVVHHLEDPNRFVDETARVLDKGGRIDVLEPCRNNPLILLHALTNRAERGELRSTPAFLARLLERRFDVTLSETFQAFPIHRIVFHPDLGRPALAKNALVRNLVDGVERLAERVTPGAARAYIRVRAVKKTTEMFELTTAMLQGLPKNGPTDPIEFYRRPLVGRIFRERINRGLGLLPNRRFKRALEVGYGAGAVQLALADGVEELHGIHLDADAPLVSRLLSERSKTADLRQGSVYELPYENDYFDLCVSFSVFEHLHEYERAFREVKRVLEPGGLFLLGMPAVNRMMEVGFRAIGFKGINDHHVTTPRDAERAARSLGFRVVATKHLDLPLRRPLGARVYYDWLLEKPRDGAGPLP